VFGAVCTAFFAADDLLKKTDALKNGNGGSIAPTIRATINNMLTVAVVSLRMDTTADALSKTVQDDLAAATAFAGTGKMTPAAKKAWNDPLTKCKPFPRKSGK